MWNTAILTLLKMLTLLLLKTWYLSNYVCRRLSNEYLYFVNRSVKSNVVFYLIIKYQLRESSLRLLYNNG